MYVKQSVSILLYRKMKKKNGAGKVPIYLRLTIDGLQDEMATGIYIHPDNWNQDSKMVTTADKQSQDHNKTLGKMVTDVQRHFDLLQVQEEIATPQQVFAAYRSPLKGERIKAERTRNFTFSDAVDQLIAQYCDYDNRYRKVHANGNKPLPERLEQLAQENKELIGRIDALVKDSHKIFDSKLWEKTLGLAVNEHLLYFLQLSAVNRRSPATLEKMWGRKRRVLEFLAHRYELADVPLAKLNIKFLQEFKLFNITQKKVVENTAERYNQALKETMIRCVNNGWVATNVFDAYRCHYDQPQSDWPTMAEMVALMEREFTNEGLEEARDIFVFCSFTGLSYAEVHSLSPIDIITGIDGGLWVSKNRQKTGGDETLPLLPIPLALIEKYADHPVCLKRGKILPVPTNQEYNRRLKVITSLTGIRSILKSHKGRYFFANEVTFNQGVQLKTIARMLGQKSDRAVHVYVKANREAISNSMKEVKDKLFAPGSELNPRPAEQPSGGKVINMKAS